RDVSREVPLEAIEYRLSTSSAHTGQDERARRVEGALRMLPHAYHQVICWHYYEHCHHEEIGRRLGISPDAARHLFHRAMKKLADDAHKQEGNREFGRRGWDSRGRSK